MRKLFALVLLFMGCAFAQELVDVDVSKFPPNIVRKSSTTENSVPKVNATTNTLVVSSITDNGTTVTVTDESVDVKRDGIATTTTDGLLLSNNTTATVGVPVQYSPRVRLRANWWDTDEGGTGATKTSDWWIESIPVSGTSGSFDLVIKHSTNGAASITPLQLNAGGVSYFAAGVQCTTFTATSSLTGGPTALTAGTMTAATTRNIRTQWHQYSWTNAMVIAAGDTTTTFDVTIATLPAKTRVVSALIVIATAGTNMDAATFTVQCGTDATFSNYILTSNALAAANTVYGDVITEVGTSLDDAIPDLPSWTATTAVKCRFITNGAGGKDLADVLTSTGSVYLCTETLP